MMKLTLLASLLLVTAVVGQCPVDYTIPNLVAGISASIQIHCKSQSLNPRATHPKHIDTIWQVPSPLLLRLLLVLLLLFSSSRFFNVIVRSSRFLHLP